ncbi:MAG: hypothetical protein JSW45_05965 [Thiotrichales bacterium]|nr:MAG: hypothetical protein JSW45_05965 [Thiotrichales bacterium]
MSLKQPLPILAGLLIGLSVIFGTAVQAAEKSAPSAVYDETAYTEYVEKTMEKLDKLYLDFCGTCNSDASVAVKARKEFLATVRDLMQHMNSRFDNLDPKEGDALSPTETLVSIHVLTMLVDILTETQIQQLADHPYSQ